MLIISHRGFWLSDSEKNKEEAFKRSFLLGYGTETDVRDFNGNLVISHDIATQDSILLDDFFQLIEDNSEQALTFALNIKADGLCGLLSKQLERQKFRYEHKFFVFDMSVPDMKMYVDAKSIPVFTRMSEFEQQPAWFEDSNGIWLDSFGDEWYGIGELKDLLSTGKDICVVSPELHNRPHQRGWSQLSSVSHFDNLILCTDIPMEAQKFFKESV